VADIGIVRSYLGGLPDNVKKALGDIFTYVLPNIRVGLPGHQKPAENLAWIQLNGTTPSTGLTEFSIAHGLGGAPRVAFPCLDLTSSGTQLIPLICSRPADSRRVYLRSTSTSASFTVFVEAIR
jgi:hypothetical protein